MTVDSPASPPPSSGPSPDSSAAPSSPQNHPIDSGLWALQVMGALHQIAVDEAKLRHEHGQGAFDTKTVNLHLKLIHVSILSC